MAEPNETAATTGTSTSQYPESDKMLRAKKELGLDDIRAFWEWLDERGLKICAPHPQGWLAENGAYAPLTTPREQLFAQYAEVDLDKVEEERRAMLDEIRAAALKAGGRTR